MRVVRRIITIASIIASISGAAAEPAIEKGDKKLPLPGEAFRLNGKDAFVILPEKTEGKIPWVWYAPTLPGLPAKSEEWMFRQVLEAGVAVAGIDVGESYGSPSGREVYGEFYDHLVGRRGFSAKPCLLARSRGGLMLYSWAVDNSGKVAGVAGIYPVCNVASYPGVAKAAPAFGFTAEELTAKLAEHNPIDRLKPLAEVGVPIRHIHGDKDKVVPIDKNSALLEKRYRAFGGPVEIEVVKGGGHDMWEGWFKSQALVDFIITEAKRAEESPPDEKS